MKAIQSFLFIFLFSFTEQTTAEQDVCPPWFTPDNTSSSGSSYSSHATVKCGSDCLLLLLGNCITYDSTSGVVEVGHCPYIAYYNILLPLTKFCTFSCQAM